MNQDQRRLELLEELIQLKRRQRAATDFNFFIEQYLNHLRTHQSPLFHKDIIGFLKQSIIKEEGREQGGEATPSHPVKNVMTTPPHFFSEKTKLPLDKRNRLLFVAPRGFAKSTLCSIFFPLWLALNKHRTDIFVVSATISLSRELLRKIRNELENNELLLKDFGEMKSDKWTEEFLILNNGTAIRAKGRGFQIRGFRPDMIICDDLEDEESLYSKDQRDKLENWFMRTLLPALKPDQNLVYIGTKLHQLSLISKLEEKTEFFCRKYMALVDGKSIWEDLWSTETLKRMRNEIGTYAFEAEYQNNPISLEEQPIKPHYLEGVSIRGKAIVSCLAVDPAISEREGSDYRAVAIFEEVETEQGVAFREKFSEQGRWSITEQIERIIDLYDKYRPERVIIEEVAFQAVIRKILLDKSRNRMVDGVKSPIFIPVSSASLWASPLAKERRRPKDKLTRLLSIAHLFEQRLVEIVNPDLRNQLLTFPFGDYDDLVDATVYALFWLMNWRTPQTMVKSSPEQIVKDPKRSFYVEEVRPGVFVSKQGEPEIRLRPSGFFNYDR